MQEFLQKLIIALSDGSSYALIALGYTMVYGVLRLINFAHGDIFMLGAFVGVYTVEVFGSAGKQSAGMGVEQSIGMALLGIFMASLVCGVFGYAIERVAYRPLRKAPRLSSLITAIGVSLLIEYLAQIEWHFRGRTFFGPTPTGFPPIRGSNAPILWVQHLLGVQLLWKDVIVFAGCFITLAFLWLIVQHTRTGKAMRAVSVNYDVARLMGINLNQIISFTFVLGSVLAAIGGCLWGLNRNQIDVLMGLTVGLKAFVAAVIGGIGNIPGAAVGGFLLGIIEVFASGLHIGGVSLSPYKDAIAYILLIVVLLVKPEGIFGKALAEKV